MKMEDGARLEEYIRSYQELLAEKGYDEKGLNNVEPEGTIDKMIERAFRNAHEELGNETGDCGIIIQTFGKPSPENEQIMLDFIFSYQPQKQIIDLKAIKIDGNDFKATIVPRFNGSIPELQKALEHVRQARAKRMPHIPAPKKKNGKSRGL